jgi:hypothetical protein
MLNKHEIADWNYVYSYGTAEEVRHYIMRRPQLICWVVDTRDELLFIDYYEYGWFRVFHNFLKLLQEA